MNFNKRVNLTLAANSFVIFINCSFNATFNIDNIGANSRVFINSCNFTSKVWTQTTNNGSILVANCTNLPSLSTLLPSWFLAGYNGTETESQLNTTNKGFYDSLTNTKYLYTSADISATANILGTQLANTTITASKIANNTITNTQILDNTIALSKISKTGALSGQFISFDGTNI
jgi:hypothetical protein